MQVNWIDIKYIGGPVSLAVLVPNDTCPFQNKHPIILLGDHHRCHKHLCNYQRLARHMKMSETIVHTNVPLWFRLLDSYGTDNYPVQYFFESYFEPNLLNDPFYSQPEVSRWISNSSSMSFMNYIIKFHPSCISKDKSDCITKNIKYEFADLRLTSKYHNMKDSDRHMYQALDYLETTKIKLKLDKKYMKDGTTLIKGIAKNIDNRKKSPDTDDAIKILSNTPEFPLPFYENQLSHYLTYFLGTNRFKLKLKELESLLQFRGIDFLLLIRNKKYIECANLLFNSKNKYFISKSKLYKAAKELDLYICKQMFIEYFVFFLTDSFKDGTNERFMLENLVSYSYDIDSDKMLRYSFLETLLSSKDQLRGDEYIRELNAIDISRFKYHDTVADFVENTVLAPFNDMFMLFTSLKNKAPLTVYNAGNSHTSHLYTYLLSKGYYMASPLFGWNYVESPEPKKHKHCITVDTKVNLDQIIRLYMNTTEQLDKLHLNIIRRDALGPDMLLRMLKGHYLSKQELLNNQYVINFMDEYHLTSFDELVKMLQLKFLDQLIPNEYIQQASTYN